MTRSLPQTEEFLLLSQYRKTRKKAGRQLIIGTVLFLFNLLFLGSLWSDIGKNLTKASLGEQLFTIFFFSLYLLPSVLLIVFGFRNRVKLRDVLRFERFFTEQKKNIVLFADMEAALGLRRNQISDRLNRLVNQGLLQRIRLTEANPPRVLLSPKGSSCWKDEIYLNKAQLLQTRGAETAGLVLIVWFLSSLLLILPLMQNSGNVPPIILYGELLPMLAGLTWLLRYVLDKRALLQEVQKYNQYLEGCDKEDVPFSEIAAQGGISLHKVQKDFNWLLRKNILINCAPDSGQNPKLVLTDIRNQAALFSAVFCPHCGTGAKIRIGRSGPCPYCGSLLAALLNSGLPPYPVHDQPISQPLKGRTGDFLDSAVLQKTENKKTSFWVLGAVSAWICFLCGVMMIESGIKGFRILPLILLLGAAAGFWIRKAVRTGRLLIFSQDCAVIFSELREAVLSGDKLSARLGRSLSETGKFLHESCRRKLLRQCRYENGQIQLTDPAHQENAYLSVICPHCGGDLLLKKGTVRDCPYCGSFIDEKGLIKR